MGSRTGGRFHDDITPVPPSRPQDAARHPCAAIAARIAHLAQCLRLLLHRRDRDLPGRLAHRALIVFLFRPIALQAYRDWCVAAKALAQDQQALLFALQIQD